MGRVAKRKRGKGAQNAKRSALQIQSDLCDREVENDLVAIAATSSEQEWRAQLLRDPDVNQAFDSVIAIIRDDAAPTDIVLKAFTGAAALAQRVAAQSSSASKEKTNLLLMRVIELVDFLNRHAEQNLHLANSRQFRQFARTCVLSAAATATTAQVRNTILQFVATFEVHPQIVLSDVSLWPTLQDQFKRWQAFMMSWLSRGDHQAQIDFVKALLEVRAACKQRHHQLDAMLSRTVLSFNNIAVVLWNELWSVVKHTSEETAQKKMAVDFCVAFLNTTTTPQATVEPNRSHEHDKIADQGQKLPLTPTAAVSVLCTVMTDQTGVAARLAALGAVKDLVVGALITDPALFLKLLRALSITLSQNLTKAVFNRAVDCLQHMVKMNPFGRRVHEGWAWQAHMADVERELESAIGEDQDVLLAEHDFLTCLYKEALPALFHHLAQGAGRHLSSQALDSVTALLCDPSMASLPTEIMQRWRNAPRDQEQAWQGIVAKRLANAGAISEIATNAAIQLMSMSAQFSTSDLEAIVHLLDDHQQLAWLNELLPACLTLFHNNDQQQPSADLIRDLLVCHALAQSHPSAVIHRQKEVWSHVYRMLSSPDRDNNGSIGAWCATYLLLLGILAENDLLEPSLQRQIRSKAFPWVLENPRMASCGVYLAVRMKHSSQLLVESLAYIQDIAFTDTSATKATHYVQMIGRIVLEHAQLIRAKLAKSIADDASSRDYMGRAAQKEQEDSLADREVEEAVIGNGSVFACFIPFLQALAASDKPPLSVRVAAVQTLGAYLACAPTLAITVSALLVELAMETGGTDSTTANEKHADLNVNRAAVAALLPVTALDVWTKHCAHLESDGSHGLGQLHVLRAVLGRARQREQRVLSLSEHEVFTLLTVAAGADGAIWLLNNNRLRDERTVIQMLLSVAAETAGIAFDDWFHAQALQPALTTITTLPDQLVDIFLSDTRRVARVMLAISRSANEEEPYQIAAALDVLITMCLRHTELTAKVQELSPALVREAIKLRDGLVVELVARVPATAESVAEIERAIAAGVLTANSSKLLEVLLAHVSLGGGGSQLAGKAKRGQKRKGGTQKLDTETASQSDRAPGRCSNVVEELQRLLALSN